MSSEQVSYSLYASGQVRMQEYYKNGAKYRKCYYENGQLWIEDIWLNGYFVNGERKIWRENGRIKCRRFYNSGSPDGELLSWHENGVLSEQCFYRHGKIEGEYKTWNKDGSIAKYRFYFRIRNRNLYKICEWNRKYRRAFLNVKKRLYSLPDFDIFIISDLLKIF
jgi:antitoxin component YwqK of YwqJK toxin-antitoxin module